MAIAEHAWPIGEDTWDGFLGDAGEALPEPPDTSEPESDTQPAVDALASVSRGKTKRTKIKKHNLHLWRRKLMKIEGDIHRGDGAGIRQRWWSGHWLARLRIHKRLGNGRLDEVRHQV
jgi:hypothetical protein